VKRIGTSVWLLLLAGACFPAGRAEAQDARQAKADRKAEAVRAATACHQVIVQAYMNGQWTGLAEDRALRELIGNFFRKNAEGVLRRKGEVPLPNKLSLKLLAVADRELQAKREAWVTAQLAKVPAEQKGAPPAAEANGKKKHGGEKRGKKKHR